MKFCLGERLRKIIEKSAILQYLPSYAHVLTNVTFLHFYVGASECTISAPFCFSINEAWSNIECLEKSIATVAISLLIIGYGVNKDNNSVSNT